MNSMLVPLMVQLVTLMVLNSSCLGSQNPELPTTPPAARLPEQWLFRVASMLSI